ncbi:MAG TPA: IclR family transcriptional regulator [Symbiobacteriaceae bacterium]
MASKQPTGARTPKAGERDSAVKSLTKALDLMSVMGKRRHAMGVTELAAEVEMNKSSVHRLLKTLAASGYVDRNPTTRQYFLGPRLFALGKVYDSTVALKGLARPVMERLAQQHGEAVHLTVPARSERGIPSLIMLEKIESNYHLTLTPYPGALSPAYCTGAGKVLLAYVMEDSLAELAGPLPRYTVHTVTDVGELRAELATIRDQGYAFDREELEIGLTCVAAPVWEGKQVIGAISLSGPTTRLTPDRFPVVRQSVLAAAREISDLLR